jgi:hypothetical protein
MSVDAIPLEPEEREWLLERCAELVDAIGWQRFVRAPLLLPDERSFPDPWTADARGIRRLALRLLAYAELGQLEVSVEVFSGNRPSRHDPGGTLQVAAWFAGIEDGVCKFGCARDQLHDAIGVVAAMAHEVAHAFRRFHRLEVEDHSLEERLTDLTTIALGFGVLTTNAALRHRSSFRVPGDILGGHKWSREQAGYLPPAAMSYALAIWWLARGNEASGRRAIGRALELNQRGWFRAALGVLAREDITSALGLPATQSMPRPRDVAELVVVERPERPDLLDDGEEDADDEEQELVFRLRRRLAWEQPAKFKWVLIIFLGAWLGVAITGKPGWGVGGSIAGVYSLLVLTRWHDRCSHLGCTHVLEADDDECPGCGRLIAGTIDELYQRVDAEHRYELSRHAK